MAYEKKCLCGDPQNKPNQTQSCPPPADSNPAYFSRHIEKLELVGYIKVNKTFKGKLPNTSYQLTKKGTKALTGYWQKLDVIRRTGQV